MTRARTPSAYLHPRPLRCDVAKNEVDWRHGYEPARTTDFASATLFPLLIGGDGQRHLKARCEAPATPQRLARHADLLTASGRGPAAQAGAASRPPLVPKLLQEPRS